MERMLVVVFDGKDKAVEALEALKVLNDDQEDVIALKAYAVLVKHRQGAATVVKSQSENPEGTLAGTAVGALIGLIGGPVGAAVGGAAGFVAGAATDLKRDRVGSDFLTEVGNALQPGNAALVAEIDEDRPDLVNAPMERLGGRVLRRELTDLEDAAYTREKRAKDKTIARAETEHAKRRADYRRSVKTWIDALIGKLIRASLRRT